MTCNECSSWAVCYVRRGIKDIIMSKMDIGKGLQYADVEKVLPINCENFREDK